MARKSTKRPGALVKLFRRKRPGLGMIVETKTSHDVFKLARERFNDLPDKHDRRFISELRSAFLASVPIAPVESDEFKLFRAISYYTRYDKYSELAKQRTLAKVRWFKRPSDWERTMIDEESDWYPVDILRTVSEIKKSTS
tara:strand:+ start:52 stop:474 length:423 start_codon:yes stop_codon:yes gene_type:complete